MDVQSRLQEGLQLRKTKKTYEVKLSNNEPLDTEEQEALVQDMRSQSKFLTDIWRVVLVVFGGLLGVIMFVFTISHLFRGPEAMYFHRVLVPLIGSKTLVFLQVWALIAYFTTAVMAYGLPYPSDNAIIAASLTSISSTCGFGLIIVMRGALYTDVAWIPLANLLYLGVCAYAIKSAKSFDSELESLGKIRYRHAGA